MYGQVRFAAKELAIAAAGVLERADLGSTQRAVRLHLETHALRTNRTARHPDDLSVDERHPHRCLAGPGHDAGGVEHPAGVLVAAVGLVEDLEQMPSWLQRGRIRRWPFAGRVPVGPPVVVEAFQPILHHPQPAAGVTEIEAGAILVFDVPFPHAGVYQFEITIDGEQKAAVPVTVSQLPPPAPGSGGQAIH